MFVCLAFLSIYAYVHLRTGSLHSRLYRNQNRQRTFVVNINGSL